jgi:hypothetical protein
MKCMTEKCTLFQVNSLQDTEGFMYTYAATRSVLRSSKYIAGQKSALSSGGSAWQGNALR